MVITTHRSGIKAPLGRAIMVRVGKVHDRGEMGLVKEMKSPSGNGGLRFTIDRVRHS